ncbi:hypothetical protein SAMN02745126_02204 [Enhydrobacter aerosaccus]|uniref:Uncharacterized protein n=1 Tax=Enhydrobacter aerosaccus TaxID=225324 RepID=A0A1T4NB28_9HYPH|nr:hypothetical protein [Enhydrobacter aerosaccus]SJZ76490.1 hypothetical protein SAMN02745126_02204 [Enhydrobacter aerosaccus]
MAALTAIERCRHFGVADIRGLAYMPGPSDYTPAGNSGGLYETSDFYTNVFTQLWGFEIGSGSERQGRGDLQRVREQLGVNFIHCYDWAAPIAQNGKPFLEHATFLEACHHLDINATVPISNYTMDLLGQRRIDEARDNVRRIVEEIYVGAPVKAPLPGAGLWKIFNEYELSFDRNPEHVVTVMAWIAEWEREHDVIDENRLPIMVCTSFALKDGIEGAAALKDVRDVLLKRGPIGDAEPSVFWNERIVFATNPQNPARDIADYLDRRLPAYWTRHGVPAPPVMFTELGSSIEQAGGEPQQAQWLAEQLDVSKAGGSDGLMLGACVFLNEERPWEQGAERSFGLLRFGPDKGWGWPRQNYRARTANPVWDPKGWWWLKEATYPVEQQTEKLSYRVVEKTWSGRSRQ